MTDGTLIEISEEDLNVSKLLHKHGQFPHSIFYLQQSIEKLVKHLGVSNNIISPDRLQSDISHKTEKIFKALAFRTLELTGDTKDSLEEDYKKIIEINRNVPLNELLPVIKMTIETSKNYNFPDNFSEIIKSLIVFIQKKEFAELSLKVGDEKLNNKIEEFKKVFPKYHSSVITLFILSNFFSDYVSYVRYPTKEGFHNPSHIFTYDNELVIFLPYFFQCQYENINNIYQFQSNQRMIKLKY
jgi:hypothetical protein